MHERTFKPSIIIGLSAAIISVAIGVAWQLATRLGATTTLHPVDLTLFRYGVPALVLSPLLWRIGLLPAGVGRGTLALMVIGAGLPFGLIAMAGAQFASIAHMGVLLPGTMPLFVALFSGLVLGERFTAARIVGLLLIIVGVLAIGAPALANVQTGAWRGDLLFLTAALLWGVYTVAFRRSGLEPWTATAVVSLWSGLMVLPAWFVSGAGRLASAPLSDVAVQVLVQGLVAGIAGLGIYAMAVRHLGPSRAAAWGALVPVASAVGGWMVLGETVDEVTAFGIAAAGAGVAFSTGVLDAFMSERRDD